MMHAIRKLILIIDFMTIFYHKVKKAHADKQLIISIKI